jgi:galactoside O-acetyltransferase
MENIFFDLKRLKHLGRGAIVGKAVRIRKPEDVIIGDHTIIDDFTYISCALEMGCYCHIGPNVTISGGKGRVTMRDFAGVAAGSTIHAASSEYAAASFDLPGIPEEFQAGGITGDILFEDHVLLGSNSVVMPGVYLPEGFASTAHTVIRKAPYEPWTLYGGFACKKLCKREHADVVELGRKLKLVRD